MSGFILHNNVTKVFISNSDKVLFKLKKRRNICGCSENYETNYAGLVVRIINECESLSARNFPPAAVNVEKNENIKLDYVSFKNENDTRNIYSILSDEIDEVSGTQIQNFLDVASTQEELTLFEIKRPHYGVLRGEVVSVLMCQKETYEVLQKTEMCTKELQVITPTGVIKYVNDRTNILKNEFKIKQCSTNDLGKVYRVYDERSRIEYITQEEHISVFSHNIKNIEEYERYYSKNHEFDSILSYDSFANSGIYDEAYLNARNNLIFSGEQYSSADFGLTGSFSNNNENWKEVASQGIDFTDYINPKKLYDMILDHPIMAVVRVILTVLSAIGGVATIFNLTKHIFSNTLRCSPTFVIMKNSNRIERVRNRRQKILRSDTESEYNDTDDYETDDEVHLKKRIISEAPPPYS